MLLMCSVLVFCTAVRSALPADVAIISSSDILPYTTCREGIQEYLAEYTITATTINEDISKGREALEDIKREKPKVVIAIGPQAAFALAQEPALGNSRLFCMILNPQRVLAKAGLFSGVSLNIPPDMQMRTIKQAFANRKRVGIFYSKDPNQEIVDALTRAATAYDLVVVPLPIGSAQEIPGLLSSRETPFDVLLIIPDEKLGSTKIVEYLIKESLRRNLPVVGYNSWFAKNGAVLSFIIDYRGIGRQTGAIARRMLNGSLLDTVTVVPPEHVKISIDVKTAEKIGVAVSPDILKQADEVQR